MADDDDDKSEEPTGRKLSKARDDGDVVQSMEIKTASMLLAALVIVWLMAPHIMMRLRIVMAGLLERSWSIRTGTETELNRLTGEILGQVGLAIAMPFALFMVVALVSTIGQVGWMVSTKKITPEFSKISPLAGFKRLFSMRSVVEFLKSLSKIIVVGTLVTILMMPRLKELEHLPGMELMPTLDYLHHLLIKLLFAIVLCISVIAAVDWLWQRYTFMKKMRMTKQEVKDENKQSEGDPMIKSRLRSLRMQRARQRMMSAVPKADVIVTNPTHYACALKYDGEAMGAPILVAKGKDLVALRIRQVAEENDVPIVENPPLARALFAAVELDREIPPEHYKAVAEVISYVMRLKGKRRK